MLKLHFRANENRLEIVDKEISFPFSSFSYGDKNVLWNLNSIECKNIRGNFRLLYCRRLDFSTVWKNKSSNKVENLTYLNSRDCGLGQLEQQDMLLSRHLLLFHDEKNPKNLVFKKKLPLMLLSNAMEKKVQFFIWYEKDDYRTFAYKKTLHDEDITLTLNLFEEG